MLDSRPPLIVILGPTASGKTRASLAIARAIGGEIISADSRQLYRHMTIGTAKPAGAWRFRRGSWGLPRRVYEVEGIRHYLVDILDPDETYSVAQFRADALRHIANIHLRGKVPMLVGGTGLYIQSVIDNYQMSRVPPDPALRATLAAYATDALYTQLVTLAPVIAKTIDRHNRHRLIRAIERASTTLPTYDADRMADEVSLPFRSLQIGIHRDRQVLYTSINTRAAQMITDGLIAELTWLLAHGYDWDLPSMSSVGYRQFRPYIDGTASLDMCVEALKRDTRRYAKRQLTWFRRDPRIVWCSTTTEALAQCRKFLA